MKNLAIIYDKETRKYANYLKQLIMQNDDTEDKVVGVEDGTVNIQVYSEEQYEASFATFAASQYILFIGNGKIAKESREYMKIQFKKYGMRYSWLGRQSALYIDHSVRGKDYPDFLEYARKYQDNIRNAKESLGKAVVKDAVSAGTGAAIQSAGLLAAEAYVAGGSTILSILGSTIFFPAGALAAGGLGIRKVVRTYKEKKQIKDQQYCCLLLKYYMDGINKFLNQ